MKLAVLFACGIATVLFGVSIRSVEGASIKFAKSSSSPAKIVCYVSSWANYRQGKGKFVIEDIDPFLCTHLIYAFAKLQSNQIAPYDPYLDLKDNWGLGAYERITGLKQKNSGLKVLIAIGGWNDGSAKYSQMAANPQARKTFVDSCISYLKKYGFDGLDVDWEYPANRGGAMADKSNFVLLLKELKEAFEPHGLLLTAAVSAGKNTIDTAYDISGVSKYLDFINLMAYDFNGAWNSVTGHNAPLTAGPGETGDGQLLNVEYAVKYWLKGGTPPNKLVLGMPFYGRAFQLQDANRNGVGSPATGKGLSGRYTGEPGYLGYSEICEILNSDKSWKVVFDQEHKVPYAYKDNQWFSYDNTKSIALKVDFVKKYKLGGAMVWSIEIDDFTGTCNEGKYPLLTTIKKKLSGFEPGYDKDSGHTDAPGEPTTVGAATTTKKPSGEEGRPVPPTKAPSGITGMCKQAGFSAHPLSCKKFINCVQMPNGFQVYEFDCAPGTVFSKKLGLCTYPYEVPECENAI